MCSDEEISLLASLLFEARLSFRLQAILAPISADDDALNLSAVCNLASTKHSADTSGVISVQ